MAQHGHKSLAAHVILGGEMESDIELVMYQHFEKPHEILVMRAYVIPHTLFACLHRVPGEEVPPDRVTHSSLGQATST